MHASEVRVAINAALKVLRVARDRELLRRFYLYGEDKKTVATVIRQEFPLSLFPSFAVFINDFGIRDEKGAIG